MSTAIEKTKVKPEIGMGVTEFLVTDRHAYTVIEVGKRGKSAKIQRDQTTRLDNNGLSESQVYSYQPDSEGEIKEIKLYADGEWHIYRPQRGRGNFVNLDVRREYRDPSF